VDISGELKVGGKEKGNEEIASWKASEMDREVCMRGREEGEEDRWVCLLYSINSHRAEKNQYSHSRYAPRPSKREEPKLLGGVNCGLTGRRGRKKQRRSQDRDFNFRTVGRKKNQGGTRATRHVVK